LKSRQRHNPEAASGNNEDSHNESVDSTDSNIGTSLQPENGESNSVPMILSPSESPCQSSQIYTQNEEKREDGESGNFSDNAVEKINKVPSLDSYCLHTDDTEERKKGTSHAEPHCQTRETDPSCSHTPLSENMPLFPDSRSDENHAQIASDIIGEDNGKTLENTDLMSPTISKNRLAELPLPLPKNTQKDPEGTLATLPLLTCVFCNVFATPIVFDMANHLLEKHKP